MAVALPSIRPDGDHQVGNVVSGTWEDLADETDATYIEGSIDHEIATTGETYQFDLGPAPADLDYFTQITVTIRAAMSAPFDDSWSGEFFLKDKTIGANWPSWMSVVSGSTTFVPTDTPADYTVTFACNNAAEDNNKAWWDANSIIHLASINSGRNMGADGVAMRFHRVEITGLYEPDTTPPPAPSALTSTETATRTVKLEWTDGGGDGITEVERAIDVSGSPGTWEVVFANDADELGVVSFLDQIPPAEGSIGDTFHYRARARDPFGNYSAYSNVDTATLTHERELVLSGGTSFSTASSINSPYQTTRDGFAWHEHPLDDARDTAALGFSLSLGLYVRCTFDSDTDAAPFYIETSPDGSIWTEVFSSAVARYRSFIDDGTRMIAVGDGHVAISSDGTTWTETATPGVLDLPRDSTYSPALGLYVAGGSDGSGTPAVWTSPDALAWTEYLPAAATDDIDQVAWSPTLGMFAATCYKPGAILTSTDGATWINTGAAVSNPASVVWAFDEFRVPDAGGGHWTSPDGSTWSSVSGPGILTHLEMSDHLGLLIGSGTGTIEAYDGTTWTTWDSTENPGSSGLAAYEETGGAVTATIASFLPALTQSAAATHDTPKDPEGLQAVQVGDDVVLTWNPTTLIGATHFDIFRRTGTDLTPFNPEIDIRIDRIAVGTNEYTDVNPGSGDFVYQVYSVIVDS